MATVKVVFSLTEPQLVALRHIAKGVDSGDKLFRHVSRDPRRSLVEKGLLEHTPGNYGERFSLTEFGRALGFEVHVYPEMRVRGDSVSSSRVRELLGEGRVARARHLLDRVFSVVSTAGRGRGFGHKFTVPTINLSHYDEVVPANGVYVTRTRVGNVTFDSVTNVGVRPTFGADSFAVESHLLHFHPLEVTADTEIEICFFQRLRDEIKFPSVEALREQIAHDVRRARHYFALLAVGDG